MKAKLNAILYIITITMIIVFAIGCIYKEQQSKTAIHRSYEVIHNIDDSKQQIENKIEIEIDKEVDTQAIAPVKDNVIFNLTDYERWVVECMVMGESGGESYEGQVLVAQCILNACLKDNIQPSKVKTTYKYSGWKENPTKSVKKAVSAVFDLGEKIVDEPILYFYAPLLCQSKWHETQVFVIEFGGHRFFKEKDL